MSDTRAEIPRKVVAQALDLPSDTDALPPGALPLPRFAERFILALASDDDTDVWTIDVFHHLVEADPQLALDALSAALNQAPDAAESLGEGPLTDLLTRSGADVMTRIETAENPAMARALSAVDMAEIDHPLLRARIEAAQG